MSSENAATISNQNKANDMNAGEAAKYVCGTCNKAFQWKSGLSRHFKLFHVENKDKHFKCDICDKLFYKQVGLSMHVKQHRHNVDALKKLSLRKTGSSTFCRSIGIHNGVSIKQTQKISHLYGNIVSETIYSSDSDCEYEILQTVTKLNNPDSKSEHKCQFCEKHFVKLSSLQRHLKKHNDQEVLSVNNENDSNNSPEHANVNINISNTEIQQTERTYSCNRCSKSFKLARNLTNHLKIHLKQSVVARKELTANSLTRMKPRYCCSLCNKIYFKKVHLDNHLVTHSSSDDQDKEKESCPECNKEFRKEALEIHKQTHTLTKPYLCMVCGKDYSRSGYLSIHMRTHSNYRPHLCSVCGKAFTIKRYLIIHSRIHTQERPFRCQHCNKGFIQKGNLIEHLRIHSGVKPHICAVCGKRFTHYSGLTQHLLTHNPVKRHICKICGKAFRQGGHYREHMRIHSGDRPFVCNICDRGFASSSSLVVHSRTHSGERPFKCLVCKKGFIKSYGLKQHKKTHTACNLPDVITS